jgi:hypothetical protein
MLIILFFSLLIAYAAFSIRGQSHSELIHEWYALFRIVASNTTLFGISFCAGLLIKNFRVALIFGCFCVSVYLTAFIFDPEFRIMANFIVASFVVVIGIIALTDCFKNATKWLLIIE